MRRLQTKKTAAAANCRRSSFDSNKLNLICYWRFVAYVIFAPLYANRGTCGAVSSKKHCTLIVLSTQTKSTVPNSAALLLMALISRLSIGSPYFIYVTA